MSFNGAFFLDTNFSGTVFVASAMILSVLGLYLVRRRANLVWLKEHHEIASFFFLMIGTLYAVLIAFAIFTVWNQFQASGTLLEQEANEVGNLSRMSMSLPQPLRQNIRLALLNYLDAVQNDEFPAMAEGRESQRTWDSVENLWKLYNGAEPANPKELSIFSESIRRLNELCNARRQRLFASRGTVPTTLWYLLYSGGILLVAFTYLFGHESFWSQAIMTAALAGILAFSLFLIVAYDSPYAGVARVSTQALQLEQQHVAGRDGT